MQALAANVAGKLVASGGGGAALGPRELWERQEWFQHVLNSPWNSRDRKAHARDPQARGDHLDMLVFYLRLSRNALAHAKPWERESGTAVDVRVLEALLHVLDQSLAEFNELMVSALAVLQLRGQPPGAVGSSGSLTGDTDREGGRGGGAGRRGSSGGGRRGSGGGRARGSVAQAVAQHCAPTPPGGG
ncbi:hypothetical protein HYH03_016614 [Edaphochlamys debaryana]|uniref:Uncharacterized protein n=1 Tax=Edaphochlamys debaryana TaxID=47281 RepID=A0A836BPQ2_9CHLO|nr:hypothetical protein HYH03_016614 [Edaphochlamys debaryana]|eukprot:KAG2484571.1 hypothetical protein HYH03_016614 [Edaphochlamys debaryana]